MNAITQDNASPPGPPSGEGQPCPATATRLQAIHELIWSGGYNVPAKAIADRMVERMIVEKRGREA